MNHKDLKAKHDAAVTQASQPGGNPDGPYAEMPRPKARPMKVRPKPRPTIRIGGMPGGSTRGIDPRDNYSPEDLKRLLMQNAMEAMEEAEEEGMIVYVGDQKFEYSDYTLEDAMRIVDEYADEMEGEPYEVYNADGKLVASGTMRSGAFHEPGIEEGYYVMPDIDKERYTPMQGLEGPFQTRAGKPIYYDPKEGAYYDRDTDMYLTYDEFKALDENVAVRRDGKTLSKAEIAKLQRQGVLMKEDDEDEDEDDDLFKDDEFTAMDQEDDDEVNKHFAQDTVKKNALEALVDIAKTAKKYKGGVTDEQIEILGGLIQDMDLAGIELEKYSAVNELFKVMATDKKADMTMIQPAYAQVKKIHEDINEGEEKSYICVHAKKGKHECRAESSYAAAKKAAEHWGLKSTSGIDAHLAVDESITLKNLTQPKRVIHTNKQNFRKNFAKRYTDMYPSTSTAEGHSPHKKGTKKYKAHMAAMHANSVDLNTMRDALKLDESADANTVVAEYTRATLNHSYKTWKQVNEQITFIRSFIKEDVDVNAVATMLHKMHERENLDHKMLVKENVSKLRQIVKDKSAMSIKFADGSMKVDMTTASIFLQVFDKVKEETQAKIIDKIQTKAGFLSMLDLMYKKIG